MDQIDNDLAEFAVVTIVCDDRVTSHSPLLWRREGRLLRDIIDQFDNDLAERQPQASFNHMSEIVKTRFWLIMLMLVRMIFILTKMSA